MFRKTTKLKKAFKAATGGIYDAYKPLPTDIGQLGGNTAFGQTGDSLSAPPKIAVQQDNTNYTQQYALKGAQVGASLMAVNPVVGVVAAGVGATVGAIGGALKESKAKAQNRDLVRSATDQQIIQNKAWNNDSINLAKQNDMRNSQMMKRNSIGNKTSFYGDYNIAKKGMKVTKADDGYFSNNGLDINEVNPSVPPSLLDYQKNQPVGSRPIASAGEVNFGATTPAGSNENTYKPKSFRSARVAPKLSNAGAYANAGMQLADAVMSYSQPTTGYMYRAKNGMRLSKGGSLESMSSDTAKIKGPSHANGGVDVTEVAGSPNGETLEAEGKETMKDTPESTMIFSASLKLPGSDKTFAQAHEMIATQKGKIEKKMANYAKEPRLDNKTAITALGYKNASLEKQENMLFELQQQLNGNHSNEENTGMAKKGMNVFKSAKGSDYIKSGTSVLGGALQYYNLENRVRQNQKARSTAVDQIAGLSIPQQKRLDNVTIDYARNDVARADVNTQLQNFRNTIGAGTSGNQLGSALTGLYGKGLEQNASLIQDQENAKVAAKNATTTANLEINSQNNQNSYQSSLMRMERDKDVINDRANLTTDYNKEHSEYVTDNFRKEAFADKSLAYQYAGLSTGNQTYLQSLELSPEHWQSNSNRALGSFKKGGNIMKNKCGGKLVKAGIGAKLHKDCGCK